MKLINQVQNKYKEAEFSTQQSVRFFIIILFCISGLMLLILFYTSYLQLNDPIYGKLYFPVLIPELSVVLIAFLCYVLLLKGKFYIATHLFLITTFSSIWIGLWYDRGNLVQRIDTVAFVLAVLTMIPLFFNKKGREIFIYIFVNISLLAGILFLFREQFKIEDTTLIDIFADFSISMIFIGILGNTLLRINKRIYNKAVSELNEKIIVEKKLSESESKYKELTDMLPQVVWEIDLSGKFTYTNQKGLKIYGYTKDDFIKGIFISDVLVSDKSEEMNSTFIKQLRGNDSKGEEFISITKDGTKFPVQIFSTVIVKDGKTTGFRGITIDITERKKAEEALLESEGRYKALMESMNEVIIVADNEHKVEFVNHQFTQKLGYSEEEIIGKIGYKMLHDPEDLLKVEHANTIRLNNKNSVYELTFKAKDGSKHDFLVSGSPYKNSKGETIGSIGALMDITERKKTENKLVESEHKYRTLFENAQIGIYQSTPDGKILNVNPAILSMLGYTSLEELKTKNLQTGEFHAGSGRTKFLEAIEKEGFVKNFESEWKDINGETIYIIENAKAVKDTDGKTLYFDGFVENITERKKAEQELIESEQRYRSIIEAFPDILIISDERGKIVFMNEPAQKITGITRIDFEKPTQKAKIHPGDRYMVAKATKELLSGVKEHSNMIENRFIDAWGNVHWFSGIMSKITMNGKVMIQTISRDITEKKETELELESYRNHLEMLVKDRTEELYAINEELKMSNEELITQREVLENALEYLKQTQNRLIQSEKMASLGIMAAGVAHEINNPLNFINGGIIGLENWLQENLPESLNELEPLLHGMNEGIRRASTIVAGLNKYSREDESSFSKCNIASILESCIMMLNYQIKDRIRVIKEYSHEDLTIFANEGRLHQAFLNILSNSVQAIEEEGEILIQSTVESGNMGILIKDNGCGISEEDLSKIMDPFYTTKEPGKGTGLGLSITYNIIRQHKGTIDIESKKGKGTQILIQLPVNPKE